MGYGDRDYEDEDYEEGGLARGATVTFEGCEAVAETIKGLLVAMSDGAQVWWPKSQIHEDSEVYKMGTDGKLVVTEWIAEQKGLV